MQAVIYARISKDRTGAGLGVNRQVEDCERLAATLGWNVVETYSDNDVSAYSGRRRPSYDRMLKDLASGRASAILAWHADRLHRRPVELEDFITFCEEHRIEIRTVNAGDFDLSTASGKMVARMLGAAARHEVEHSIERQKRAKAEAAEHGKYRGGRRPFGWDSDGMTLNHVEAQSIQRAANELLAGRSLRSIVKEWNESGLRTSFGNKEFNTLTAKKILLRPRNAGYALHEGRRIHSGQWEHILDVDTFTALEALITDPARGRSIAFERRWQGSGVYVCGRCSDTMLVSQTKGVHYYRCASGPHLTRVADQLDALVSSLAVERLADANLTSGADDGVDVDGLRTRREALQIRLDELATMFADGTVSGQQLQVGSKRLRADLAAVEAEIAAAQQTSVMANMALTEGDIEERWEGLSPDLRGKVIAALMTVTVLPAPKGRRPGGGYFDPDCVQIDWLS
ncbi:recombinase family protein [Williamsia muralis]|uniref:Recombinase n=1 Tax=Williamsia marianensis TaxID=85044 RepID=A0A2G3PFP5_WILMA|nr:recombinase family protein [Williamsia marianensis]PHV64630.1 recombinase [Williamsia marianensis]